MNIQNPTREELLEFLFPYTLQIGVENISLPTGEMVRVEKYLFKFKEWHGATIPNTYGNKAVIDHDGKPMFAELAVLNIFKENGWDGVWVDSYRNKFRIGLPDVVESVELPEDKLKIINGIKEKTDKSGGCWDLFLWKDDKILFVELKRLGKDRMQKSQTFWLEKCQSLDIPYLCFLVVEWFL